MLWYLIYIFDAVSLIQSSSLKKFQISTTNKTVEKEKQENIEQSTLSRFSIVFLAFYKIYDKRE